MKTFCVLLVLLFTSSVFAQPRDAAAVAGKTGPATAGGTLRVAVRLIPPFVMKQDGQMRGFSIDLWRHICDALGKETEFVEEPDVKSLLQSVRSGETDVGIAAISITSEREKLLDFSQPMFDAGLQILVRPTGTASSSIWQVLSSPSLRPLIMVLPFLILIPAHVMWLVERRRTAGIIEDPRYLPGIGKAIWWAAGTVGAQADEMPRGPLGRFFAVIMMFASVVFVAFFTAALTSTLTVQQLQGDIRGPDDLPGKRVATIAGSTAAEYLRKNRVGVTEVAKIEQAYLALDKGQVQAVVFDSPVLLYYVANEGEGKAQVVGPIFRKEDYGIAVADSSPLRKRINMALLSLRENGEYQSLYDKWFNLKS